METVTLREHIERVLAEKDKANDLRFKQADKALELSKVELDRRLEALNELRAEVTKDRGQFVKVDIYSANKDSTADEIKRISNRVTIIETRSVTWSAAIVIFFMVMNLVVWLLK